jgi:hypothetical protein
LGQKISCYPALNIHAIAWTHGISDRARENTS